MAKCKITDLPADSTLNWTDTTQMWIRDDSKMNTMNDIMFTDSNGKDHSFTDMTKRIATLEERLSILPEPDAETLENHKMLREAYKKYKFLEGLVKENDDNR